MNRKVTVKPAKNQGSIDVLFKKPVKEAVKERANISKLVGHTEEVQKFYDSLNKAEQIAHEIAMEKLGTSYDVERTHGFVRWKKNLSKGA